MVMRVSERLSYTIFLVMYRSVIANLEAVLHFQVQLQQVHSLYHHLT